MSEDPFDKLEKLLEEHGCMPEESFCFLDQDLMIEIWNSDKPETARNWYVLGADGNANLDLLRVMLWHDNKLHYTEIPFEEFKPTNVSPDFDDLEVIDCGHGLRMGEYEAAADALGEYVEKK